MGVTRIVASGPGKCQDREVPGTAYPEGLEEWITLRSGERVFLRPIRPEDAPAHLKFFERLSPEDIRFRFFTFKNLMPPSELARYTRIDYDREMALLATTSRDRDRFDTLGVVRVILDPEGRSAEFAIIVRSDFKGRGLGYSLLERAIRYCRQRGVRDLVGAVLSENQAMVDLAQSLGFIQESEEGGVIEIRLPLSPRGKP